ncbi:MAG: DUF1566 domain-containing protein [Treponema sp.]|jgi:hypothetical protein|nr:DUF1566 domain-containing protein [Treponema sp.]
MMNKKKLLYIFIAVALVVFIASGLLGCSSTPPKWKDVVYFGEDTKILEGNIWSYESGRTFIEVEFQSNGKLIASDDWGIPNMLKGLVPIPSSNSKTSWERDGMNVRIVLENGRNQIEGIYDPEKNTISGRLFNSDDTSSVIIMKFICEAGSLSGKTYNIGDRGPAGGIIYHDKKNYFYGFRYMEAAPADLPNAIWGPIQFGVGVTNGGGNIKGNGKRNTELLMAKYSEKGISGTAAQLCGNYALNGFNDWFLPSYEELLYMYDNLKKTGLGGFKDTLYWSSSEGNMMLNGASNAWAKDFNNVTSPLFLGVYGKDQPLAVRAVRCVMER